MKRILVTGAMMVLACIFFVPAISDLRANIDESKVTVPDNNLLYERQQQAFDSLSEVVLGMEKRLNIADLEMNNSKTENAKLREQLDQLTTETRNSLIYVIILFSVVLLLSIFLLIRIWYKHNKRLNTLSEDQDNTNEALNLHIQNTSQEIAAINDVLDNMQRKNGAE